MWCSTVTRLKLKNYTNSVSHWIIILNLHHKMLKRSCDRCRFDLWFHDHTSWMCETFPWIEREQDHASRWRDTHYLSSWRGSTRQRCAVALRVEKYLIDWLAVRAYIINNDHVERSKRYLRRYIRLPWLAPKLFVIDKHHVASNKCCCCFVIIPFRPATPWYSYPPALFSGHLKVKRTERGRGWHSCPWAAVFTLATSRL